MYADRLTTDWPMKTTNGWWSCFTFFLLAPVFIFVTPPPGKTFWVVNAVKRLSRRARAGIAPIIYSVSLTRNCGRSSSFYRDNAQRLQCAAAKRYKFQKASDAKSVVRFDRNKVVHLEVPNTCMLLSRKENEDTGSPLAGCINCLCSLIVIVSINY